MSILNNSTLIIEKLSTTLANRICITFLRSFDCVFARNQTLYKIISRKVVGKKVHATIPKGIMGYAQYTVSDDCSCRTYFCCFHLALANICPWPSVPFFQISLKNSALKTTHNTFRDCRVHFSDNLSRNRCIRA